MTMKVNDKQKKALDDAEELDQEASGYTPTEAQAPQSASDAFAERQAKLAQIGQQATEGFGKSDTDPTGVGRGGTTGRKGGAFGGILRGK